jgi:hypothetical protein
MEFAALEGLNEFEEEDFEDLEGEANEGQREVVGVDPRVN